LNGNESREQRLPKIMVVGAHAGDCEIMTGAVIAQHTATGGAALLVHMTLGERGHPALSGREYAEQKRIEALEAGRLLGAEVKILPFLDGELFDDEEPKRMLADIIRRQKPEIVISHWGGSFHKDHAACHDIVNDAVFYAGLADMWPDRINHLITALYYGENWEDPRGFQPDLYVDTTSGHHGWLRGVRAYELFRGGLSSFPYVEHYEALATLRGTQAGCARATTFTVPPESRRVRVGGFGTSIPFPAVTAASIVVHPEETRSL
jgi:LmbE family N-acetylglucosaminyl deacetylase